MKKLIITVLTHALTSSSLPSQQSLQETSVNSGSVHLSLRLPELNSGSNMKAGRILVLPWLRKPVYQKPEDDNKTKAGTSLSQCQAHHHLSHSAL